MARRVLMSWSGGKDSALALHALQQDPSLRVVALLTTLSAEFGRVSHHGVREELLDAQAAAIGLPLRKLWLPKLDGDDACLHGAYEELLGAALADVRRDGVHLVAHGDLHLTALRAHREQNLARAGMTALFPLWGRPPRQIVRDFVAAGFGATLCFASPALGRTFAGRELDEALLRDLPPDCDAAGENGEYHSFVHRGPIFSAPIAVRRGEVVERPTGFYCDLVPA
jgi:uncharacterized protein (TIGR00290 family)